MIILALLCLAAIWPAAMAAEDSARTNGPILFSPQTVLDKTQETETVSAPAESAPTSLVVLTSDSGKNISDLNYTIYSPVADLGLAGRTVGSVVKFTAPRPEWTLKSLVIVGWSGFNNTTKTFPPDRNFLLEVRDSDTSLLYKFADTQNDYFASTQGPVATIIDIPPLKMTGDFYVVFYDRGSMGLGVEMENGTGNSYFVKNGQLVPALFTESDINETMKVNWLIRAIGQ